MTNILSRRHFIKISAAVAGASFALPANGWASSPLYRWKGQALGAQAEILLNLPVEVDGPKLVDEIVSEIGRLERIFSIYQARSAVTILNEQGIFKNPPMELVDILTQAQEISDKTKGTFDVSVQPLWQLMKETEGHVVSQSLYSKVSELVDYKSIVISEKEIAFAKAGMAITLNGIAQGYITDRVTRLMASYGLDNCLVQLGETRALGPHPNGRDWHIALGAGEPVGLSNRSLATSGGVKGSFVFDPKALGSLGDHDSVSVLAPTATLADGLSTAFSVMPQSDIAKISKTMPNIDIVLIKDNLVSKI